MIFVLKPVLNAINKNITSFEAAFLETFVSFDLFLLDLKTSSDISFKLFFSKKIVNKIYKLINNNNIPIDVQKN
jgi:hypothetical protein